MSRPPFFPQKSVFKNEPLVDVQGGMVIRKVLRVDRDRVPLHEPIVAIAEAEYERIYPPGQTADRLRERGGLSISEVINLLASALSRYAPPEELIPGSRRTK